MYCITPVLAWSGRFRKLFRSRTDWSTASPAGFFGLWLRFVPLAAAMEGLLVALHWPARSALAAAWAIAGPELALTLLCFPLAALLPGLFRRRRVRPRY